MLPLNGLKILDFSTLLPGPYATQLLADMGAEVLRVESPTRPDLVRIMEPKVGGVSVVHSYLNRNKSSIALDLKKPQATEIVHRLLEEYDIVIEQFRPGVMTRLGLGYEDLKAIKPDLIYCSVTGYGQTGPYKDRAGHDINYLALSGLADYSRREGERPVPQGVQIADVAGGSHHAVMGILAAVIQRQNGGGGQWIDISMTDAALSLNAMCGAQALAGGQYPEPEAAMLNGGTYYDYYETRDGRYMSVGSLEPQFLAVLLEVVGLTSDHKLALSTDPSDQKAFKEKLTQAFLSKDFGYWCEAFAAVDACVEPVLTLEEALEHDNVKQRSRVVEVSSADDGALSGAASRGTAHQQLACPVQFSDAEPEYRNSAGAVGCDTQKVLGAVLSMTAEETETLRSDGVIQF